jgi:hypothetical protein
MAHWRDIGLYIASPQRDISSFDAHVKRNLQSLTHNAGNPDKKCEGQSCTGKMMLNFNTGES